MVGASRRDGESRKRGESGAEKIYTSRATHYLTPSPSAYNFYIDIFNANNHKLLRYSNVANIIKYYWMENEIELNQFASNG